MNSKLEQFLDAAGISSNRAPKFVTRQEPPVSVPHIVHVNEVPVTVDVPTGETLVDLIGDSTVFSLNYWSCDGKSV